MEDYCTVREIRWGRVLVHLNSMSICSIQYNVIDCESCCSDSILQRESSKVKKKKKHDYNSFLKIFYMFQCHEVTVKNYYILTIWWGSIHYALKINLKKKLAELNFFISSCIRVQFLIKFSNGLSYFRQRNSENTD